DPAERGRGRVGRVDRHPAHAEPEGLRKRLQQRRVVIHDEDPQRGHGVAIGVVSAEATGSWMRKVAPSPGGLTTEIVPPCSLMIPYVMDRPRPVPLPTSLVVKNGSKIRGSSPGGIPAPVSVNATSTIADPTEPEMRIALRGESATASRPFVNRLMKTCSSWIGFPSTTGSSGPKSTVTSISRSRSCSCMRDSARPITCLSEIGSQRPGPARPNVRSYELIYVPNSTSR